MPEETERYSPDEAREEASSMTGKIESGEAKDYDEAEQKVNAEKSEQGGLADPEDKERTKQSPIFMVYRDNNSFQKFGPVIEKIVAETGRAVETQVFPRETTESEISRWAKDNIQRFDDKLLASDQTCQQIIAGAKGVPSYKLEAIALDNLLYNATSEAILGKATIQGQEFGLDMYRAGGDGKKTPEQINDDIEQQRPLYEKVVSNIPPATRVSVEGVYIITNPKSIIAGHEGYHHHVDEEEAGRANQAFAQMIADSFRQADFKNVCVIKNTDEIPREMQTQEKTQQGKVIFVYNRHNHFNDLETASLQTPFETFMLDAKNRFGAEADQEAIVSSLKKRIADALEKANK